MSNEKSSMGSIMKQRKKGKKIFARMADRLDWKGNEYPFGVIAKPVKPCKPLYVA